MKIALVGYGKMGQSVEQVASERGHEVVARIDPALDSEVSPQALGDADVAIEFSVPAAAIQNIRALAEAGVDAVIGTTGWHADLGHAATAVEDAGTGLIYAPNFSLGVYLFLRLAQDAGRMANLLEEYDVHVWESHHRHKIDHPSGTAVQLADLLVNRLSHKSRWSEAPPGAAPDPRVLYVASHRAGEVAGTHVVGLEGPDDRIELRHEARNRSSFARGAVTAAEWIKGRSGVYTLDDMLAQRFAS
jgi:4-hydroxy-tetrahydrodipicolinate reductase